jgi:hypothetical protein
MFYRAFGFHSTSVSPTRPVMSPKHGHIAMQVNGGLLGTNLVLEPDQAPLLIKGEGACAETPRLWRGVAKENAPDRLIN